MGDRRYPKRPLIGVGAVLLGPHQEVLLIRRAAEPARGLWSFPGGLPRAGESLRDACRREVEEETGLEAALEDVAKVVERIIRDDQGRAEYHFVIVDFWGRPTGGQLRAGSDAAEARWVPVAEIERLPTTRGVAEAARRAVQLAGGAPPGSPLFGE